MSQSWSGIYIGTWPTVLVLLSFYELKRAKFFDRKCLFSNKIRNGEKVETSHIFLIGSNLLKPMLNGGQHQYFLHCIGFRSLCILQVDL